MLATSKETVIPAQAGIQARILFESRKASAEVLQAWIPACAGMTDLQRFRRFPIPDSRFPIPDSRFPIPDSRFPIPDSRFPIPDSRITNHESQNQLTSQATPAPRTASSPR
ncbi:hypothetical protein [Lysobacter auxotrophicus]|uniref:Uncharacterized protein n=1 Tax=Lysobacter auxotrophicus TaxID=2992573 RepID=A0ABM8DID2_9GAMM|nr:hypothetical protein [Lysobacter auxotrophicus]BDU18348.1 hypothetical protein LA521A_35490 [Lysobacter auxotrophicus]